jgi:phosphohistidine phosphatase
MRVDVPFVKGAAMKVIFVRHGEAEEAGKGGDESRRLTRAGRKDVQNTAAALRRLKVKLEAILSSPLLRAEQTAEIIATSHGVSEVEISQLLAPPTDAKALRSRLGQLLAEGFQAVAVVGHAPSLDDCIGMLVASRPRIGVSLSKAGAACVELPEDWPDAMPELAWVMTRKQLAMLAGA